MKQPLILKCRTSKLERIDKYGFTALPMESTFPTGVFEVKDWHEVHANVKAYKESVAATGKPTVICYYLERKVKGQRLFNGHETTMSAINRSERFVNHEQVIVKD